MEAHVVTVVAVAENAAENMLAGMLLHMVEAAVPVHHALHGLSHCQRLGEGVHNLVVLFLHVQDGDAAQSAVVGRLSAAFGIEGGAVQSYRISVFRGLARCGPWR